jgi:TonB family protein
MDAAEPFGQSLELDLKNEKILNSSGIVVPQCTYRPVPAYTDAARVVKFSGVVILEIVVSKEGQIPILQILNGAPFGLNKSAMDTVRDWKCQPGTQEGEPVNTRVPVQLSFRLY